MVANISEHFPLQPSVQQQTPDHNTGNFVPYISNRPAMFLIYRAVQLWNDLPESLTNIESFNVFKNAIKGRALDEFLSP